LARFQENQDLLARHRRGERCRCGIQPMNPTLPRQKESKTRKGRKAGFTLTELMTASGLASVVLLSIMTGFTEQKRNFYKNSLEQAMHQNVRSSLDFIQRDLRSTGSGLVMGINHAKEWFPQIGTASVLPKIVDGGTGSDTLWLAGNFGNEVAVINTTIMSGTRTLDISPLQNSAYPFVPKVGDVLLVGGLEVIRVVTVAEGGSLTFSASPYDLTTGMYFHYPAGTLISQLSTVQYSVATLNGLPCLLREDSRFTYGSNQDKIVATGIESIKASHLDGMFTVKVYGRSASPLPGKRSKTDADPYLRYELSSRNLSRNPSPLMPVRGWPRNTLITN